jgi:hypothetical protein
MFMIDYSKVKLGKRSPIFKKTDLKLAKYVVSELLPEPPVSCEWGKPVKKFGMMLNDEIGDCTVAGAGHRIQLTHYNTGRPFDPPDSEILRIYKEISGYNGNPETDNGAYLADMLSYWRKNGVAKNYISAYMRVNKYNSKIVKFSIWAFCGLYIGLALPNTCQDQKVWDVVDVNLQGDSIPGSWGGHCVVISGYNNNLYDVVTWGTTIKMTERFLFTYCDEAWACLAKGWIADSGKSPSGFDFKSLMTDLQKVTE